MSSDRERTPKVNLLVVLLVGTALWILFGPNREAHGQVREVGRAAWLIQPESIVTSAPRTHTNVEADSLVLAKTILQSETAQKQFLFMSYFGENQRTMRTEFKPKVTPMKALFDSLFTP